MAEPRRERPTDEQVREVVRRIVESTVEAGPAATRAGAAPTPADTPALAPRTVAIGADHGGYPLKQAIARALSERGYAVTDCGTGSTDAVDYPDFAHAVARLVADGTCAAGIMVDGAGIGSAMAANKVPGVRAANAHDTSMARNAREHNYANVLTLGGRMIGEGLALEVVEMFLATPWGAERHGARVDKITAIEREYAKAAAPDGTR
jgi:RpiB/LacA/LacB family sugar-phosphate isomerase